MILLVIVTLLVLAGFGHRVLDRLRLSDQAALAILVAIVISTIVIPDIKITDNISFNVGGFIIPMGLAVYLFIKAETNKEKIRSIVGAIMSGIVIYLVQKTMPADPENIPIDPNFVYPIVGAIVAYVLGRSRRGAFIAGIVGVVISDLIQLISNSINRIPAPTNFGGAGGVDTTVITGILAVLIAEIFGETREKLQGGTEKKHMHFDKGHFVSTLGDNWEKNEGQNKGQTNKKTNIKNKTELDEIRGDTDEKK
ncbi:MAG TPA: DUF1614 domain-containing protein [Oscillospiraceae bacterium]|nr:DUF1614 domain-containing protein [Oscillospiraceae bacterium]